MWCAPSVLDQKGGSSEKSPLPRVVRFTFAVAYRSEGPISSTCISMTVRFSPSRVSYDRCTSRPCTMTRKPRCSDSATFSAIWRHAEHRRNSASPSFHSLVCLSNVRGVDATVNDATAAPLGVKRSSGSAVRFPITVMTVSPAIRGSPPGIGWGRRRMSALVGTDDLGAEHRLGEVELAVQLGDGGRLGLHVDHRVDALDILVDLVRQAAPAPHIDLLHAAAALADNVEELVEGRRHGALLEIGSEDHHELVMTQGNTHLLWTQTVTGLP